MDKCVIVCCDDNYIPKAIVALKQYLRYNPNFDAAIIGSKFNNDNKELCDEYDIQLHEVDLSNDFINLNDRPIGRNYPIECFYHFYAYKILNTYDHIVLIECDIGTYNKLDINFEKIDYIAGTHTDGRCIESFPSIQRDYDIIQSKFGEGNIKQKRIIGGLKIYNVKNLQTISFYERIVEYYKKSWEYNIPRCGDDSLMVLYQIFNEDKFYLLESENHIFSTILTMDKWHNKINNINCVHLVGLDKYWSNKQNCSPLTTYFRNNFIEFIYNNFSLDFIKSHLPEIYIDTQNVKIPFYFYNADLNFGDFITPYFLKTFCNEDDYSFDCKTNNNMKIISCGSIMRLCNDNTIVYGSGIRDIDQNICKGNIQLVRGPLTRKRLLDINCFCPPVYGDPALLLPLYYNPIIEKKYKLGIIPHVIHHNIVKSQYNDNETLIIDLATDNIEFVVDQINSCEKIVSSSLHGLIVSDAYNVPNKWVKFNDKINGDDTKFFDYFQSVNRKDQKYIDCDNYSILPDNVLDLIQNVNNDFDINKLKDKMFFDEKGIKNYTKYLFAKLNN